jgi:predicted ATP-dependent serine protease
MWAGPPGAGKTYMALIAAVRMKVPTLYVSADSDEDTMAARLGAAITKHDVYTVAETISHGLFTEEYGPVVGDLPIRFAFDPSEPSIADIANALEAWIEVQGEPPHLVVIDNLMNMAGEGGNEFELMRRNCKDLQWLARKSKACVLVLHHTSEGDEKYLISAPPRSAIQYKVNQLPSLIMTMANDNGLMSFAVVKNRFGPQDPKALNPVLMDVDFTNCQVHDVRLNVELGWAA